jgi:hypothetical protein
LAEGSAVKRLTVALLLASTVFAQSAPQAIKDRHRVLAGWLGVVRGAESKFKSKHGVYGDLTALREAHLLDALVFESDKLAETSPDTNIVPKSTHFEVTTSGDGEHYKVSIWESLNEWSVSVSGDEMGSGFGVGHMPEMPVEDGPEGPLLSLAG